MPNLEELLRQAPSNAKPADPKAKVCLDAAYDSKESCRLFVERGVEGSAPARHGFSDNAGGSTDRKEAGFRQLGGFDKIDRGVQQKFARMSAKQKAAGRGARTYGSGCDQRRSVDGSFAVFKRRFGVCHVPKLAERGQQAVAKAMIYNMVIDTGRGCLREAGPGDELSPSVITVPGLPARGGARGAGRGAMRLGRGGKLVAWPTRISRGSELPKSRWPA